MSLSRKHFQALAEIIAGIGKDIDDRRHEASLVGTTECDAFNDGSDETLEDVKHALADFCGNHNPNFDRALFLAACEPKPSKE